MLQVQAGREITAAAATLASAGAAPPGASWRAGEPSNTPPHNRETGGEDWLEAVVYLRWEPEAWELLTGQLDAFKAEAALPADEREDGQDGPLPVSTLRGGGTWFVRAEGFRLGGDGRGPLMRWVLERAGVVVELVNRREPHPTFPNGTERINDDVLLAWGSAEVAWSHVLAWLEGLGAEVVASKLSRVDACADLPGEDVGDLVRAYRGGDMVSRAHRIREREGLERRDGPEVAVDSYRRRITGMTVGAGDVLARL